MVALVATLAASVAVDIGQPAAVRSPAFEATLDTCAVIAALAGVWAFCATFRQTRRVRDLLLGSGLVILVAVDLVSVTAPTMLDLRSETAVAGPFAPMIGGLLACACFLAAALTPAALTASARRRWGAVGIGAGVAAALAVELAAWLLRGEPAQRAANGSTLPTAHPLSFSLLIAGALISASAAVGFLADTERVDGGRERGDTWVALMFAASVTLIVIGTECLVWFGLPITARASASVAPAEGLWLVAFCFMSLGAHHQLALQRRRTASALADRDRQRLVRDLHDTICQDLAFIVAHGARIAAEHGDDHPMAIAAGRALAASRGVIAELSASDAPSTQQALRRVADELARRFAITVDVRAQCVTLQPEDRDAIVRIVREAIVNAAKHGHAQNVFVSLEAAERSLVLRVRDDGRGLEPLQRRREGFGMGIMRERASELGGRLEARTREDGGTELEVLVP